MAVLGWEQKAYCEQLSLIGFAFCYETGINFDPREPTLLRKDGVIVSNSLAAFAYIRGRSMDRSFLEC